MSIFKEKPKLKKNYTKTRVMTGNYAQNSKIID